MADSGIESGLITSPQETVSEDSSSDLNDPIDFAIERKSDGNSNIHRNVSSNANNFQENFQVNRENVLTSDITELEQKDHFPIQNEICNGVQPQFQVSATFKLVGPSSILLENSNSATKYEDQSEEEIIVQNGKKTNITVEVSYKFFL